MQGRLCQSGLWDQNIGVKLNEHMAEEEGYWRAWVSAGRVSTRAHSEPPTVLPRGPAVPAAGQSSPARASRRLRKQAPRSTHALNIKVCCMNMDSDRLPIQSNKIQAACKGLIKVHE